MGGNMIDIGTHKLLCSDIAKADVGNLLQGESVDVVYSDPPWGQGNLTYWGTHAKLEQSKSWGGFMEAFCGIVTKAAPAGVIFVEMGMRWVDELAETMRRFGRAEACRWTVYYGKPLRPNALWYSGHTLPEGFDPTRYNAKALPEYCVKAVARPGGLVLDPCCGKGYTARAAVASGMRFRGIELNAKRLSVTCDWLRKHGAAT